MKEVSLERIWELYGNKYRFLVSASLVARELIEAVAEGRVDAIENPYSLGLSKALQEGIREEKS